MHTYGLGSLPTVGLDGPPLRHTLRRAFIAVVGPSRFGALPFARANIRDCAAGTGKQAVSIGDHERKLEGNSSEEKSMVVNLKNPPSLIVIPPQRKIRKTDGILFLPAIKPAPDFLGDELACLFNILLR